MHPASQYAPGGPGGPMILSIDLGSSSVRASLYEDDGTPAPGLESARAHSLRTAPGGGSEADPDGLFQLVVECIDEVMARHAGAAGKAGRKIEAAALSTFWHSLLAVSGDGRALSPVTTWADTRSAAQAQRLAADLDEESIRARTGCVFHPGYPPARLLWYRANDPELFRRADWWCSIGEYCLLRLFGQKLCSISMASGTGLLDQEKCSWDPALLRHLGVDESRLSPIGDMDTPLSGLIPAFALRWPDLKSVPWFPALGDGACSNIGSGCAGPGRTAVMIGTSGAMRVVLPSSTRVPALPRGLWRYHVDRRRLLVGGALGNGGNVFGWMRSTLAIAGDPGELDSVLLTREPASHGLTMLPFFTGERSVGWNPRARAALAGMSFDTSPLDILQAGMEAVAYRFAAIQALLDGVVGAAGQTVATGGALVHSRAWAQIIADVLGRAVTLSQVREASSRGAALLALESLGRIRDAADAPPLLGAALSPREERRAAHRAAAEKQERLSRLLAGL